MDIEFNFQRADDGFIEKLNADIDDAQKYVYEPIFREDLLHEPYLNSEEGPENFAQLRVRQCMKEFIMLYALPRTKIYVGMRKYAMWGRDEQYVPLEDKFEFERLKLGRTYAANSDLGQYLTQNNIEIKRIGGRYWQRRWGVDEEDLRITNPVLINMIEQQTKPVLYPESDQPNYLTEVPFAIVVDRVLLAENIRKEIAKCMDLAGRVNEPWTTTPTKTGFIQFHAFMRITNWTMDIDGRKNVLVFINPLYYKFFTPTRLWMHPIDFLTQRKSREEREEVLRQPELPANIFGVSNEFYIVTPTLRNPRLLASIRRQFEYGTADVMNRLLDDEDLPEHLRVELPLPYGPKRLRK